MFVLPAISCFALCLHVISTLAFQNHIGNPSRLGLFRQGGVKAASNNDDENQQSIPGMQDILIAQPISPNHGIVELLNKSAKVSLPLLVASTLVPHRTNAFDSDGYEYKDSINKFSVYVPPSWVILNRKPASPTMTRYRIEESLFVANSVAEGTSMGITKTIAPRLLKDFNVEWWFAPLESMSDVGPPELIAKLLIMQRQGDFENQLFPNEIVSAKVTGNSIMFDFLTPIAEGVNRKTIAKGFLRGSDLIVLWISGLSSAVDGDYGKTLQNIRDHFVIL